ncbi:MAG TPA: FmdB family zinc ribbon protein [Chloroflexota bacterium]|nr:FmdB family zinc ribbon protein [Chloroflexota bacterium]
MPLYEYQCLTNGHRFEVRHPITQDPVTECPVCGGEVRRVIHPVGIVFKGSGFYATDSRGKGTTSHSSPAESGSDTKGGEGKSSGESKPAASEKPATPAKSGDSGGTSGSGSKPAGA